MKNVCRTSEVRQADAESKKTVMTEEDVRKIGSIKVNTETVLTVCVQ
jgi:hypothetical protein